jgi:hypothetical protein
MRMLQRNGIVVVCLLAALLASILSFLVGAYIARKSIWPFKPPHRIALPDFEKDRAWADRLRAGGYILFFRHAHREKWPENSTFDAIEIATGAAGESASYRKGVCLSDQGVEEAKIIGEVFRLAGIRIGQVLSSPSCRARQTALMAFGKIDAVNASLLHRNAIRKDQHREFALALRKTIDGVVIAPGTNAALSGHSEVFKYDKELLIDRNETGGNPDERAETGFVVLEKVGAQLIARHTFRSIGQFTHAAIRLKADRDDSR